MFKSNVVIFYKNISKVELHQNKKIHDYNTLQLLSKPNHVII
jgi:hypothetical protein